MKMNVVPAALLGAGLLVSASSAHAQEAPSEDVIIVTGTKTAFGAKSGIPIAEIPQGVQVLDAEELIARDVRSVGDALRAVPSANIGTPRTSAYQSFSLEVRGFLVDQMRNGVRQRYYEDVDASNLINIERIEVLKGPSSVLFGQSALGGIVSIITKQPEDTFSGSVSGVVGSYERAAASFDLTGPVAPGLSVRFNGEIERSGTYVDFQDIDRENAAFTVLWTPHERISAHLVTEWNERRTQRNPGLPIVGTVVSNGVAEIPVERFLGDPGRSDLEAFSPLVQAWVDIKLSDNWTLTPRVSYSQLQTNFTQLRVREVQADGVTVNRNGRFGKEDDDYTIAQLDLTGSFATGAIKHNVLVGVERDWERSTFKQEVITDALGNNLVPTINVLNPVYGVTPVRPYAFGFYFAGDIDGVAVYAQDRIDLTDRWNLIVGARWSEFDTKTTFSFDPVIDASDITEDTLDHTTFQVGSSYRLTNKWSAFGGYATGFDLENVAGSRDANGNPLEPEESEQIEAGLRFAGERLRGSVSAFEIKRNNVATADPENSGFSKQTGEIRVRGVELEGVAQIFEHVSLQGGLALLDSKIVSSNNGDQGDDVADVPEQQANLFLRWTIPNTPLELRGGVNYVGERRFSNARVEVRPGLLASDVRLPDYVTVDIGAAYKLGNTRFDLAVTNLFDESFYTREFNDFSVLPGEPLQASLRITQSF